MMLEKLLKEEDSGLILKRLSIHDELKEKFISKQLELKTQSLGSKYIEQVMKTQKKGDSLNSLSTRVKIQTSPLSSFNITNDSTGDMAIKRVLNLDHINLGVEKFIVSDSPINNPTPKFVCKTQRTNHTPVKTQKANTLSNYKRLAKSIDYKDHFDEGNMTNYIRTEIEQEIVNTRLSVNKKSENPFKKSPFSSYKKSVINVSNVSNVNKTLSTITVNVTTKNKKISLKK
jgi:hypothetical protein